MDSQLVMTVIAPDRPGLVESLARIIADHHGNWLESRMAHLGGQFAGILRVSVPAESAQDLLSALRALESTGIKVHTAVEQASTNTTSQSERRRAQLNLVGQDRPGIVRQVSQALAQHHVNVEELRTHVSSAPMTGETLFHTHAEIELPEQFSLFALQAELEKIAADLMVDIKLHEL